MGNTENVNEILEGYHLRIKFCEIAGILRPSDCPTHIREMFTKTDGKIGMDCLYDAIMMTLLFIKDRTLRKTEKCHLRDIAEFLANNASKFSVSGTQIHAMPLAKYIVQTVFQNRGLPRYYTTYNEVSGTRQSYPLRILDDDVEGAYQLTDDAFDFIYRTMEVDSETEYSVASFKLRESLRKGNYKEALSQSEELIQRTQQMINNIDQYIVRIKRNICDTGITEYEEMVHNYHDFFAAEREKLKEIRGFIKKDTIQIQKAVAEGINVDEAEARQNLKRLDRTQQNITTIELKQSDLTMKRSEARDVSQEAYLAGMSAEMFQSRANFKTDIIEQMQKDPQWLANGFSSLFAPLYKYTLPKILDYNIFFTGYRKEVEVTHESGLDLSGLADISAKDRELAELSEAIYIKIGAAFYDYANTHTFFTASEFVSYLQSTAPDDYALFMEGYRLLIFLFYPYQQGVIEIADAILTDLDNHPSKVLNYDKVLYAIPDHLGDIKDIVCEKNADKFLLNIGDGALEIEMSDLEYTVNKLMEDI